MSDNDNAKPENDTLKGTAFESVPIFKFNSKAHDEWLLNSTNHAISDANQKILISLADSEFVDRLINLSKRPLDEAENVWNKLENLQVWPLFSREQDANHSYYSHGWRQLMSLKLPSTSSERVCKKLLSSERPRLSPEILPLLLFTS